MRRSRDDPPLPDVLAGRFADASVRRLFLRFCYEARLFSDSMTMEMTPFEVRFSDPEGFRMRVAPYSELFRVSIECPNPCDVRVNDREGYLSALDLALKSFLDARARSSGDAQDGTAPGHGDAPTDADP